MDVHGDLRSFLEVLARERLLVQIDAPVDARLEIPEIHRRVIAAGGPALLFTHVTGSAFPVVTNLFGTARRISLAFGSRPERFVKDAVHAAETLFPPTLGKVWNLRHLAWQGLNIGLSRRSDGPILQNRHAPAGLDRLPMLTTWPEDGGPFVTLPLVYTQHPDSGKPNLGMYRMQRHDPDSTGMHWQIGKGGGFHHHAAESTGRDLPVTVFLGGPPALILSAIAPLPEDVPELVLASMVMGSRLPLVRNPAGPHPLVATSEFALVGHVPAGVRKPEGPFGDHYGYYSLCHDYPVFKCSTLFHRDDAIWPATVVGKPRQEDFFLGDYLQDLLSPLFPLVMPGVRSLWSYGETGYHSLAAAVVKQRYPREAMAHGFRILGEGQLSLTKFLLLLDRQVDLKDFRAVLEHVLARTQPERDLFVFDRLSMDTLDYSGPEVNKGSKGVLAGLGDAIRELPRAFSGELPPGLSNPAVFCGGCLVVEGARHVDDPDLARRIAGHETLARWPLVVLTDHGARAASSVTRFLWTTFTRFEPAGDLHGARTTVRRHHVEHGLPLVVDARLKPWFPRELFCDPDTATQVTRRWLEYFPGRNVPMGDSDQGHLDEASR